MDVTPEHTHLAAKHCRHPESNGHPEILCIRKGCLKDPTNGPTLRCAQVTRANHMCSAAHCRARLLRRPRRVVAPQLFQRTSAVVLGSHQSPLFYPYPEKHRSVPFPHAHASLHWGRSQPTACYHACHDAEGVGRVERHPAVLGIGRER